MTSKAEYTKVPLSDNEKKTIPEPKKYGYGVRHIQSLLFFMCLSLGYIARAHIGVTIVAMTNLPQKPSPEAIIKNIGEPVPISPLNLGNKTYGDHNNVTNNTQTNATSNIAYNSENDKFNDMNKSTTEMNSTPKYYSEDIWDIYRVSPFDTTLNVLNSMIRLRAWRLAWHTYDWPKSTQEMILGAFFLGYFISMFPMGLVCQRFGGKIPLQIALFVNGIVSLGVPWLTAWGGWKMLCACRVVQGLSQSGFYPGIHTLLANWVPVSERGTLSCYIYTGSGFGTIIAFQIGGLLADSRWGWPSMFWTSGLMCLAGFIMLTLFGANEPALHKAIAQEEKNYIYGNSRNDTMKKLKTPWKKILTSSHVWAVLSSHVGSGVSFVFFFSQFPTYMHAILQFDVKNSGILSSLPYIMSLFASIGFGYLSDFCTNKKILSVKNARKLFNTFASMGSAVSVTLVAFTQNPILAVVLFVVSLTCHTAGHTGWMINYIDLAPNFSGAQMAFGNTLCNSMTVILPVVVANIVTDVTNPYQWRIMFLLIAGIIVVTNIFFVLFMSADIQEWNDCPKSKDAEEVKLDEKLQKK